MRASSMVWVVLACSGPACSGPSDYSPTSTTQQPSGSTGTGGATNGATDAGSGPTFHQVYADVISTACLSCHVPGGIGVTVGNLDLSTESVAYGNLVDQDAAGASCAGHGTLVVPNEPGSSIFFLKVNVDDPTPCGAKMPLSAAPLSRSQADEINAWIEAGAKSQ